jgi:hypothetical protein
MPRYIVHVVKREVIALGADISLCAKSAEAARANAAKMFREDRIDDRIWWEEDVSYIDEPLEITSVQLDGLSSRRFYNAKWSTLRMKASTL